MKKKNIMLRVIDKCDLICKLTNGIHTHINTKSICHPKCHYFIQTFTIWYFFERHSSVQTNLFVRWWKKCL